MKRRNQTTHRRFLGRPLGGWCCVGRRDVACDTHSHDSAHHCHTPRGYNGGVVVVLLSSCSGVVVGMLLGA